MGRPTGVGTSIIDKDGMTKLVVDKARPDWMGTTCNSYLFDIIFFRPNIQSIIYSANYFLQI